MEDKLNLFSFKGKYYILHLTWFAFFMTFVVWLSLGPMMPFIQQALLLSEQQAKVLLILNVAMTIPARIVVGMLVDKLGPKIMFSSILVLGGLVSIAFSWMHSYEQLALVRFLSGFIGAGFVVGIRMISEWFPAKQTGTAQGIYRNPAQGADIHGNQQPGRWPPGEMFQGVNQDQQQQQQPIGDILGQGLKHNVQDVLHGLKQQLPDTALGKIIHGGIDSRNPLVPRQPEGNFAQHNQDNFNVADDILKSLQDKHRPLDSNLLEEEQKRHQVMPPGNHIEEYGQPRLRNEPDDLGHQKHAQDMLGQDDLGVVKEDEMHQIGKPNFDDNAADDTHGHGGFGDDLDTGAAADAGNHDNRMEHQGPVNLQVQEPNLHGNIEKSNQLADDDLKFRPHIEIPDNQIQPHIPVDDSQRQEQLDIPIGKDKSRGDDRNDNAPLANRNIADDDDDDDRARLPVLGRAGMI